MSSVLKKLQHLLSLRPNDGLNGAADCLLLAKSFLRLQALWGYAIGALHEYPCIDIAGHLGQAELPCSIEQNFTKSHFARSTIEARLCCNYLRWCHLLEEEPNIIIKFGLDDPYLLLIDLFEAGAEFSQEGCFFDVHKCGAINVKALKDDFLKNGH